MSKTTNEISPEVRQRAVRPVRDHEHERRRRMLDAGVGQALGVANADILRPSVGMVHQAAAMNGPPFMQGLFESIEDEARVGRPAHPPACSPASRRCGGHRRR